MELQKLSNGNHCSPFESEKIDVGFDGTETMQEECKEFLPHKHESPIHQHENFPPHQPGRSYFTDFEGKTSWGMSVFNLSNAIMGSGILGLAYAMANTGIILFLILLISIAILSAYSIHLLLRCAGVVGIRAYEQLGYQAFGNPGKVLAACVVTVHNIGAMSSYLFIVKSELPLVIQGFLGNPSESGDWYLKGEYLIIIASLTIILPLALMRQLGYLGYTSGLSLSCMMFFLIAVIYKKFDIDCPSQVSISGNHSVNSTGEDDKCEAKLVNFNSETAYTIPIMAFAFVCHPEVLPIYTELRRATKKRMQMVANTSIIAMFIMYLLTAVFGYLTFYSNVEAELLHIYSKTDKLILCVRLAVLVAVILTVPVVLFPIRKALLQLICPDKPFHWARHIIVAVCILTLVNVLVIFVPNIKNIFGVIGATSAPSLIFILPGIFYIRIVPKEQEPPQSRQKIQAACFAALGFLFMVMSISFIVADWVSRGNQSMAGH